MRFPEGKRRLEDHVFVVAASTSWRDPSLWADYPCHHHIGRDDTANAGFTRIDPPSYYGYVRETLTIVESHTSPGALRDKCCAGSCARRCSPGCPAGTSCVKRPNTNTCCS